MTTTTLSSNEHHKRSLFFTIFKKYFGFMALYGAIGFLMLPMQTVITFNDNIGYIDRRTGKLILNVINDMYDIYSFGGIVLSIFVSCVIPIIISLIIYRYLHERRAVDLYHAMPIKRSKLLFTNFGVGLLVMGIPYWINTVFDMFLKYFKYKQVSVFSFYLQDILFFSILMFIVFAFSTFVAVNVDTSFENVCYSLAVNGAVSTIILISIQICNTLIGFGDNGRNNLVEMAMNFSPYGLIYNYYSKSYENKSSFLPLVIWTILSFVALYIAARLYNKKNSEYSGIAGRTNFLSIAIRFVGAFCGGIFMLLLFDITSESTYSLFSITLMGIGAFLGYVLVEVIFAKGFSTIKKVLPLSFVAVLLMVVYASFFEFGGFGYEKRLPEIDNVKSVEINYRGIYNTNDCSKLKYNDKEQEFYGAYTDKVSLKSKNSIEIVRNIHESFVNRALSTREDGKDIVIDSNNNRTIKYTLSGNRKMSRTYYDDYTSLDMFIKLDNLHEFKENTHSIYKATAENIKNIVISNKFNNSVNKQISKQFKKELIEAMQKDYDNKLFSDIIGKNIKDLGYIKYELSGVEDYKLKNFMIISEDSINTLKILEKYNLKDILSPNLDNISSAIVFSNNNDEYSMDGRNVMARMPYSISKEDYDYDYLRNVIKIVVEDKEQARQLAKNTSLYQIRDKDMGNSTVTVTFIMEDGRYINSYIKIKDIPKTVYETREMYKPTKSQIEEINKYLNKSRDYYTTIGNAIKYNTNVHYEYKDLAERTPVAYMYNLAR